MKKHMQPRFRATNEELLADLNKIGEQMNSLSRNELEILCAEQKMISGMDYKISKIDAIQAELWRRSQVDKE